ncbi:MAG TPA: site-specific integrase [Chloroflexota bacterium]|nr:site-specific integrase [Chloroflexota bacterium]
MPRRPRGSGCCYQRADGLWVAQLRQGGRRLVRYAKTAHQAQRALAQLVRLSTQGPLPASRPPTVADHLQRWLEDATPRLKPTTRTRYAQLVRYYLVPELGAMRLDRLTPERLVEALRRWRERASEGTVRQAFAVLARALQVAVRWRLISHNPAALVDRPRPSAPPPLRWTAEDAKRFLAATQRARWHALWALLLGTGMRLGEALGLTWDDLDLGQGTARIARTLTWVGSTPHLQPPKTAASRRTLALPPFALEALRRWRRQQAEERLAAGPHWQDGRNSVFVTAHGTTPSASNLHRAWRAACRRAGVPVVRLHDARHLAATLLVASGLDVKGVQATLGHANVVTTLGTYAHAVAGAGRRAAEALQRALGQ